MELKQERRPYSHQRNTITAERQEMGLNGVAGISWPVIFQPLYYNHYLQKRQPICRNLRLLFNQRVISQETMIIGVSKVHKHIQTLLCPAKLSFFSEIRKRRHPQLCSIYASVYQFQWCPSPSHPSSLGNRGVFAYVIIPGGWAFPILSRPGGWTILYSGATPGHLTLLFSKDGRVYRGERGLCQRLACLSGTRKTCTCRCFKKVSKFSQL